MLACLLTLQAATAAASEQPCKRNADGSVTCSEKGLKTLTDAVLDGRAKVAGLEAKLDAVQVDKAELRHMLDVCRADLKAVPPPPDPTLARVGYGLGVVGGALVASSPWVESSTARLGLGTFGLAALGVGFAFVTW